MPGLPICKLGQQGRRIHAHQRRPKREREGEKGGRDSIEETKPPNDKKHQQITASSLRQLFRRRLQSHIQVHFRLLLAQKNGAAGDGHSGEDDSNLGV